MSSMIRILIYHVVSPPPLQGDESPSLRRYFSSEGGAWGGAEIYQNQPLTNRKKAICNQALVRCVILQSSFLIAECRKPIANNQ